MVEGVDSDTYPSPPPTHAMQLCKDGEEALHGLHPVAVLLSYLTKAPLVPAGTPVVNALSKQRAMLVRAHCGTSALGAVMV